MCPPSPNPTSVFKWEDSSALEHSCWQCPTKSNSPKAIHTCYGIHSIPCMAYHSTMHAIGTSHRCSGCVTSREMHEQRHREIATLVAEYHSMDVVLDQAPPRRRVLGERNANMRLRDFVGDVGLGIVEGVADGNNENEEHSSDLDTVSTTTGSENNSLNKSTKAEKRERKKALKAQRSVKKAAKNEARHPVLVTADDIKKVEKVLHGEDSDAINTQTHPLATDKTIEDVIARNLGYVKQIQCHKQALFSSIRTGRKEEQERKKARRRSSVGAARDIEAEAVVDAVLIKLGIEITATQQSSKKGRASSDRSSNVFTSRPAHSKAGPGTKAYIVAKLREAIQEDLEKHENDLRQTYIRAGGFFRYAGKAVFERMTEIARSIDLQTGEEWEKKRKREALLAGNEDVDTVIHDDGDEEEGEEEVVI